jgi:hypothetical protein
MDSGVVTLLVVLGVIAVGGLGYAAAQILTSAESRPDAIFVSLRREDEPNFAGRLCDCLLAKLGRRNVFIDVELLSSDNDPDAILRKWLSQCETLIVIIGRRWVTVLGEDGRPRIHNPEDYIRREVEMALKRRLRIIPILVEGARMPESGTLPEAMQPLRRYNALEMSHANFPLEAKRLVRALRGPVR